MRIVKTNQNNISMLLSEMKSRAKETDREVKTVVEAILNDVQDNGDDAVRKYETKFSGVCADSFEIPSEELKRAFDHGDGAFKRALSNAAKNIREFHKKQIEKGYEIRRKNGALLGQIIRGLDRAGIYVPGGTAGLVSIISKSCWKCAMHEPGQFLYQIPRHIKACGSKRNHHADAAGSAKRCRWNPLLQSESGYSDRSLYCRSGSGFPSRRCSGHRSNGLRDREHSCGR